MTQRELLHICDVECTRLFKMPEHKYSETRQIAFYDGFYHGLKYMIENKPKETE